MSRNLAARLAVAAVAIPIILWISYQGGWWLYSMLALLVALAAYEFLTAEGYRLTGPIFWSVLIANILVYSTIALSSYCFWIHDLISSSILLGFSPVLLLIVFMLLAMLTALGKEPPEKLFTRVTRLFWGVFYISVLYALVFLLATDFPVRWGVFTFSGGDCLLFLFGILWVGDTTAMGIGKWIGKHKLAPTVSPNKTVEGFVGGLVGALAIGVLMVYWKFSALPWYHVLLIALGCSVFGQLGDLVESMWKRSLAIKDSSAIIPGHGGVLDRFDSLLFAAPFMYAYLLVLTL